MAAVRGDGLARLVEVEEQGARAVVTDHRLYPEKARHPRATHHRFDAVQAGGRIEEQVPGRQLGRMDAEIVLDDQPTALVGIRILQEERRREVTAATTLAALVAADCLVDLRSAARQVGRESVRNCRY